MKNNIFLIILFFVFGCSSGNIDVTKISCPNVMFAAEHSKFIAFKSKEYDLDNISYKANINNSSYQNECSITNQVFEAELSILFIITPNKTNEEEIKLPFYVALVDNKNNLVDIQYHLAKGNLKLSNDKKEFSETELITTVKIKTNLANIDEFSNTIIIGFMLENKVIDIVN